MFKKSKSSSWKINILVVPEGMGIRQFSVPKFVPLLIMVLLFAAIVSLFEIIRDYYCLTSEMPQLARLEKENRQQKIQNLYLARRIDHITGEMKLLGEFDRKLKKMVNFEKKKDEPRYGGVGGADPSSHDSERARNNTRGETVRSTRLSFKDLEDETMPGREDGIEFYKFLESQKMLLASMPSLLPTLGWISSDFGYQGFPLNGERKFHKGIDIATRKGSPVVAPADGIVCSKIRDQRYGRLLVIKHGCGLVTKYGHLQKILVKKWQSVSLGETIALTGNSGRSKGPRLHYEVYLNGVPVNPLGCVSNQEHFF